MGSSYPLQWLYLAALRHIAMYSRYALDNSTYRTLTLRYPASAVTVAEVRLVGPMGGWHAAPCLKVASGLFFPTVSSQKLD